MSWEDIIKRHSASMSDKDKEMIRYVMNDGSARTLDSLMDDIYTEIEITKKLTPIKRQNLVRELGRPAYTKFGASQKMIRIFLQGSPDYESKKIGKNEFGRTIHEFRYIGE